MIKIKLIHRYDDYLNICSNDVISTFAFRINGVYHLFVCTGRNITTYDQEIQLCIKKQGYLLK